MSQWKTRLVVAGLGCTALLLAPVSLTALGNEWKEPAYTINTTLSSESGSLGMAATNGAEAGREGLLDSASAATPQPAALPQPSSEGSRDTPAPTSADPKPAIESGAAAAAQAQSQAKAGTQAVQATSPAMEEQIRQWISTLAKEKGFEAWVGASWDIYPLGPGTHGWVILIRSKGQELGYLVVSSTEDGAYKLMEYGTGENPLFGMETLYHSMVQRGLISESLSYSSFLQVSPVSLTRWYIPPLQAIWQVAGKEGPVFLDAKTGEELPDIGDWLEGQKEEADPVFSGSASTPLSADQQLSEAAEWEPQDPFIRPSWLKGTPMEAPDFAEWKSKAAAPDSRMVYSGKWYGGRAIYPLAVSGYHIWPDEIPYIRLEHVGSRYVSFEDAGRLGGFYP
jgi:hypothetical protein